MSVRDAASTLGRSQVFTPFENRLGRVTRSGVTRRSISEPKDRLWRPEHLFTFGLNAVAPKHYSKWDGHLTCYVLLDTSLKENYTRSA